MTPPWFRSLSVFAVFNLIVVPILGRVAWDMMLGLHETHGSLAAILVSLVTAAVILLINVVIFQWTKAAGLPRPGQMILFIIIAVTFVLPIGTGRFSPVNFIASLMG
ncbi:hypothetical protein KHP62_15810 [Rhodobacteraceae bacterium NNCM2]|nr:hypothetical protein [Coraliihabitans acroporae]